mmetsp:Transcript_4370/g.19860  ORF Transcript_4370/g.19860 Transcript_4370/m.19860 type:complete len:293 (+) Transcript_4370:2796-3674(+)
MRPRLVDACVRGRRVVGETHRRLGVPRPGLERVHPPGTRRVGGGDEVPPKHEPPIRPQRHRHGARPARVTRLLVLQKLLQDVGALLVHVNVRRPARGLCPEGSGELGDLLTLLVEERRSERIRDYSHPPLVPQRVHQTRVAPVALPHVTRVHRARSVYPRRFTFLPTLYLIPSASHHLRAVPAGAHAGLDFVPVELLKVKHRLVLVLEPHAPPALELLGAFRGPSRVQSLEPGPRRLVTAREVRAEVIEPVPFGVVVVKVNDAAARHTPQDPSRGGGCHVPEAVRAPRVLND